MKHLALLLAGAAWLGGTLAARGNERAAAETVIHNDLAAVSNAIAGDLGCEAFDRHTGQTLLHTAARCNRLEIARFLLDQGAKVNARDYLGMTPLHWAAYLGHQDMAALLLQHAAEVNAAEINGLTPLHLATTYGHDDVITLLLEAGADVSARTYEQSMTPLHWAAFSGHTESLLPLLKHGADINARDSEGDTPLTWAEAYLHYDLARFIARKGGKRHDVH